MSERNQITYMQLRLVRMASERWNLSIGEAADIFTKYKVFEYIRDCFGIFHAEGDEAVWEDLIPYLRNRGAIMPELKKGMLLYYGSYCEVWQGSERIWL